MQNGNPTNRSSSPTPPVPSSAAHTHSTHLLAVARRVDSEASVAAVTKAHESTLVKIDPGPNSGTSISLATLAALRVAFPFATVTAVESYATGCTQFHVLLHTNTEELRHARELCRERRSMRAMRALSNMLLISGLCAYGALLYATAIDHRRMN